jgi:hypothetical protein
MTDNVTGITPDTLINEGNSYDIEVQIGGRDGRIVKNLPDSQLMFHPNALYAAFVTYENGKRKDLLVPIEKIDYIELSDCEKENTA